jgi:hypothetical protein
LGFGFVFAQSQAAAGMFFRSSLAKTPKSLAAERLQFFFKRSIAPNERIISPWVQEWWRFGWCRC